MMKAQNAEEVKGHINILYEYKKCLIYFLHKHKIMLGFFFLKSTVGISFTQNMKYCTKFLRLCFIAAEKLTENVKKQWKKRCNVEKELVKL